MNRLFDQLDVVKLLKTIKTNKIITHSYVNARQRALVALQRTDVITSCSSDTESSEGNDNNLALQPQEEKIFKVFAMGKLM